MLFGVVSGVGSRDRCIRWGGDRRRGIGTVWGVNVGHPIVTNGGFVA